MVAKQLKWTLNLTAGMPNTLTLENLSSELSVVSNWHQLLLSLGVQRHEFSKIQEDYQGNDRQRMETISLWLQHTPDASWFAVVRALEQFGERRLAENIHRKYIGESWLILSPAVTRPVVTIPLLSAGSLVGSELMFTVSYMRYKTSSLACFSYCYTAY